MATVPSVPEIKEYQRNEKPTEDDPRLESARDAAVQMLCDATQRELVTAGTAAARTFVPEPCTDYLYIGDNTGAGIVVVENGVTLTAGTHYQLEPVTRTTFGGAYRPYDSLRRLDGYWYTNGPRGTVVVTVPWGWSTLSARFVEAVQVATKDIVSNRDVQLGLVAVTDVAGIVARTNPVVRAFIEDFAGRQSWGIA